MYKWICDARKSFNRTQYDWSQIKKHLQGIWNDYNTSLDLVQLHQEILNLQNAPSLKYDAAQVAENFLDHLKNVFPSFDHWYKLLWPILAIGIGICVGCVVISVLTRVFISSITTVASRAHGLHLHSKDPLY